MSVILSATTSSPILNGGCLGLASARHRTENSWIQLKSTSFSGTRNYIDSIVYSPDGRFGLTISFFDTTFNCRLIEMATGKILQYEFQKEYYPHEKEPFVYYFVDERNFVLVSFTKATGQYEQQLYNIDTKKMRIGRLGYPILICGNISPEYGFNVGDRRGCEPLVVKGKRYLVLPSVGGLILTPYHPWLSDPVYPQKKCIYISFALNQWKVGENTFSNNADQYHCYGSKIYLVANKPISMFQPGADVEDSDIIREHFDRFVVLDLTDLDLEKSEVILNDDSKFSIVKLRKFGQDSFASFSDYYWSQDGKYLMAEENKTISALAFKRPASKRRIYVIDMKEMTTSVNMVRTRKDCLPSIYNGSLLIWRSRLPIERRVRIQVPKIEFDVFRTNQNIYEFKTIRMENNQVPSLQMLTNNYFMLGRNCLSLPKEYIDRYFNV